MRKILSVCFLLLVCSVTQTIFAQSPQPTATPEIKEDEGEINISTNLIQVDFVVVDKKNKPVSNLNKDDFEIFENGIKQDISNFSFISSKKKRNSNVATSGGLGLENNENGTSLENKIEIPSSTENINESDIRRTIVIVIDDIGLSFRSVRTVKNSVEKFVKDQVRNGDLVTIVTTGGATVLPAFTSDKKQLMSVVKKIKWAPRSRGGVDYYEPIKPTLLEEAGDRNNPVVKAQIEAEAALLEDIELSRKNNSVVGTLGALEYIIGGMQNLPGRKSLILFSEGFSLSDRTQRNSSNADKSADGGFSKQSATNRFGSDAGDALKSLVEIANQSSVVIYPIDPRGLQYVGMASADEDIRKAFGDDFRPGQTGDKRTSRESYFGQTQDGLRVLAKETGGFATLNQNNLNKGLDRIMDDQSYYLLSFVTSSEDVSEKKDVFENVQIKVKNPDLEVRYRNTFYSPESRRTGIGLSKVPREKVGQALAYPFRANEIKLSLYSITGNYEQGDFIRFLVNISAKDLEFKKEKKGMRKANFDLLAITLNEKGKPINQFAKNFSFSVNEATYKVILKKGFVYDLPVMLKKSGTYHFRIAVHDSETGKVGAAAKFTETPKFEKKKLWISNLTVQSSDGKDDLKQDQNSSKKMFTDTTLRQFKLPITMNFGAVIYNPKTSDNSSPDLEVKTRLIKDEEVVSESQFEKINTKDQKDFRRINLLSKLKLNKNLKPGNYILQVIVKDKLAKKKEQIATQWIDFEVTG